MAKLDQAFNPDEVPKDEYKRELFPAGEYLLQIVEADIVDTKNQNGKRLILRMDVIGGEHDGRPVFEGLNIQNVNATAQAIAQRQLADLCLAMGVGSISDTDELLFKPFRAKIGVKADPGYEPRNVMKRIIIGDVKPASPVLRPAPAPAKAAAPPKPAAKAPLPARPWAS